MGQWKRSFPTLACVAATLATAMVAMPAAQAVQAPHDRVVGAVPGQNSPNVQDGNVKAIAEVGNKIILGGNFTQVANRGSGSPIVARKYILAYDKTTGDVDPAFVPVLDDEVFSAIPGPTPDSVYIAGKFNNVNGVARKSVALLDTNTGALVTTFKPPAFNGLANDLVLRGSRLYVGGAFTKVASLNHNGLTSLNATNGKIDAFVNTQIAGHHNWNGTGAKAAVQVDAFDITPDGATLIMIGNFKTVDGLPRDQIAMLDLTGASAVVKSTWATTRYTPPCARSAFDSYVRDVDISPDGSYFVVVSTGAHVAGTLCDTTARWNFADTGSDVQPRWIDDAGGDTSLAVAVTGTAVYVGGHMRWLNNPNGADSPGAGAVARPGLASLDPVSGLPFSWNPGRDPRGFGADVLLATPSGLYVGMDTEWIGTHTYRRGKIAFFPLADGAVPPPTTTPQLPGKVYQGGLSNVMYRVNVGGPALSAIGGGPAWLADNTDPSPYRGPGSTIGNYTAVGSVDSTVPSTTPTSLFSSERWDGAPAPDMHWGFPAAVGTQLDVRLYFANRYAGTGTVGKRKFNVALDGTTVLSNFDIVATTGHNRGTMKSFTITSDGSVDIDFSRIIENPLIDGIEIVRSGPAPDPTGLSARAYDGTTAGAATPVANPDATNWSTVRGAFLVGGTLFYGRTDQTFWKRSFDGTSFGTPAQVDPYHDPIWDNVITGSGPTGQTYRGTTTGYYAELPSVTGAFFTGGRLYYSLSGQSGLFYRLFNPESGIIGGAKFTVTGATGFTGTAGLFGSGTNLYRIDQATGNLYRMDFTGGVVGAPALIGGPTVDGTDWRSTLVFLGS